MRKDVRVISERLEASLSAYNLRIVTSTEDSKASLISHVKTESSFGDLFLFHEAPHEVLVTSIHGDFRAKSENAVSVTIQTLSLLQRKELKVNALPLSYTSLILSFFALELG